MKTFNLDKQQNNLLSLEEVIKEVQKFQKTSLYNLSCYEIYRKRK